MELAVEKARAKREGRFPPSLLSVIHTSISTTDGEEEGLPFQHIS